MKVLLVLLDGMRPDGMMNCSNKYVNELLSNSAYSLEAESVFPSVTLPCHFSLMHSVKPDRHGILTNTYVPQVRPIDGLFEQLHKFDKTTAFFHTWGELRDIAKPQSIDHIDYRNGSQFGYEQAQTELLNNAVKHIEKYAPDFVFYYNGMPDEVGHQKGWMSQDYLDAINIGFDWLKTLMESLPDDYVTIVIADHGGHDRVHGTTMKEDMTIPLIIHGKGIENRVIEKASILDIAPTIAKLVGINKNSDWEGNFLV